MFIDSFEVLVHHINLLTVLSNVAASRRLLVWVQEPSHVGADGAGALLYIQEVGGLRCLLVLHIYCSVIMVF